MVLITKDTGIDTCHKNANKATNGDASEEENFSHCVDINGNHVLSQKKTLAFECTSKTECPFILEAKKLYVETPLIESLQMSKKAGCNVFLKMENLQPCGSFKLRGLSYHCLKVINDGCKHLVSSSGGNAGLAVSYIGRKLGLPVTVFVPETTSKTVIQRMHDEGAEVRIAGRAVDDAVEAALKVLNEGGIKDGALIHPFDHENIWEGHSYVVEEIAQSLRAKPDLIVLSVGGGGLLCGLLKGMHRNGWQDVPVLAMETDGAHSFASCLQNGGPIAMQDITSVAVCLGVRKVTQRAYDWTKKHNIISEVIPDHAAVQATAKWLDDHMMLVEPSCGAALAAVYGDTIDKLRFQGKLGALNNIVVIACGGRTISLKQINEMKVKFGV